MERAQKSCRTARSLSLMFLIGGVLFLKTAAVRGFAPGPQVCPWVSSRSFGCHSHACVWFYLSAYHAPANPRPNAMTRCCNCAEDKSEPLMQREMKRRLEKKGEEGACGVKMRNKCGQGGLASAAMFSDRLPKPLGRMRSVGRARRGKELLKCAVATKCSRSN